MVGTVSEIAVGKGCTISPLAPAWVMAQGIHIFPVSGTKKMLYLQQNAAVAGIYLTQRQLNDA